MINGDLVISRCSNQLRVPHGLPLHKWTHLAFVFSADDKVIILIQGVKMAEGLLSKSNCQIPTYAYLQLGRDALNILSDSYALEGAMDEIRVWKVARDPADIYAKYQHNVGGPDLILLLLFNSAVTTNWLPSGADGSSNGTNFIVQNVKVSNTRSIQELGISGDGGCYYRLFTSTVSSASNSCDNPCELHGILRTCGSKTTAAIASVYKRGSIGIGGLSPLTGYELSVEFMTENGKEYEVTQTLSARTLNVTVPGTVEYIGVVERSAELLEIHWSPVNDDGGSDILRYLIFFDGVKVRDIAGGNLSTTFNFTDVQSSYKVTIQAENAQGVGSQSNSLFLEGLYSDPAPQPPQQPAVNRVSGGSVDLVLDENTRLAVEYRSSVAVIEQREALSASFLPSTFKLNGASATVYNLRHNTVYIFRLSVINGNGIQSAFSTPKAVRTGDRETPSKTPQPSVFGVTGGSIKLVLKEPLNTGGLPIAQFNLFILYDGSFSKLKSILVSNTSTTTALVTRDADGSPLRPQTSYIFKALALQANVVCDTLTTDDLASDPVTATTSDATTPIPPSVPSLLLLSGCTVLVTASPPDDLGGAGVTGMTFGVFLSTGVYYQRLTAQLYPAEITLRNLLANTSYSVRAAFNTASGDSEFGQALNFTTLSPSSPGKLKRVAVTDVGSCWAQMQWEGPEDTGGGVISGYLLYQRTTTTAPQELIYNGSSASTTTSYLAERLLAKTSYIFSVVPINQYGLAGLDANVIVATTSDAEVPFAPTSVTQTHVSGGYVELTFVDPSSTGGFALKSLQYLARLETMSSCYDDVTSCSTCTHASDASGAIMPVDTASCFPMDSIDCYLNADTKCGVLHVQTETEACISTTQTGTCRVEGLTYLTTYVISIAAKNNVGSGPFSDRIGISTTDTTQPGVPQLLFVSATGGSIALQWKLSTDTGGASITRMHLSVDGAELFNTESALIYTHCGGLVANTDYTYTIEIENAAGLVNRATSTFTTASLTPVGPLAISKTFVGMETAKFGVTVPCDDGGSNGGVSLSYRVFHVGDETVVTHGLVGCCSISINGLEALIEYRIEVQGVSSTLSGEWSAMNFTTLSGIPSNPDTKMMFVTATTLKLELVAPSSSGGSSLAIEVIATRVTTATVVFQASLICSVADQAFDCPHTLSIDNIDTTENEFTYIVSVRAVGDGGSSAWVNQSYDLDDGSPGKIGFAGSTIHGTEGKSIDVNVTRIYGTTGFDQADFTISAGFMAPKWSCEPTSSGATCSINAGGANSGHVVFEPGDYLKTITISSFDDSQYESEAVSLNLALASTTTSALGNTHCKVIFGDNGDAGALGFEKAVLNVVENQGRLRIIIMRTGGSSGTVSVTMTSTVSSSIIGYQLNQVVYFADGINKATRDIDIRSSDAYEVRRYTVMLSNPTNGATASGNLSVTVQDKGDVSLPGLPQPEAGLRTGGCITLVLKPPKFLGGSSGTVTYFITVLQPTTNFYKTSTTEASSIAVCDLEVNTIYTTNVRASNAYGSSSIRSLNISTKDISAPTEVVQLLADTVTGGYAKLSWLPPLDKGGVMIDTYIIRVMALRYDMTRSIQVPGSKNSLSVGYLEVGMWYTIFVRGVNSGGLEGPEVRLEVWTGEEAVAPRQPPPPELIFATGGALNVSVLAPLDCGGLPLLSYVLSIARHIGGTLEYRQYAQNYIPSSTYDDQIVANVSIYGLLSNSEYFIIVSVQNEKGWSSPSDGKSFFTTGPTRVSAISPPVVVLQDPGELTLNWSAPLDTGGLNVVGYKVQSRRQFLNGSWSSTEVVYENRNSLAQTALISNILPNTQYAFSVSGYNFRTLCRADEDVTPSDELFITTQDASVPSQPKNLRMIQVTGGSVSLAWDPPRSSGGESLLRYLVNGSTEGSPLQLLANVSASSPTSLTLYGFMASSQYEFAVAGENIRGYGLYSASVYATTSGTSAPGAPKELRQISVSSGGMILLAWEPPDDSGGAEVKEYKVIRDNNLIGVVLPDEGTTKFQDQDKILADKSYNYWVYSSNDVVSSSAAATLTAHSAVGSVPAAPSATAKAGGGFIKLSLSASPDTGGLPRLRFELTIRRGTSTINSYDTTDTTFTATGLDAETEYLVIIRSVNSAGKSESYILDASTSDATVPDKPSVPRLLEVAGGHLIFGVDAPANFGGRNISGYSFYVNGTLGVVEKLSNNEYNLVGLTALTFYSVTVSARNLKGESGQSDSIVVSTKKITVPGLVWNISAASVTPDSIVLEWKKPLDTGGDAASISYAINVTTPDGTIQTSSDIETLTQSGLDPAAVYVFQVSVVNAAGSGLWSPSLSVTTNSVSAGVINFMSSKVEVSEKETSVTLTLLRTGGGFIAAKCLYFTRDGTALAGDQYVESSGEIDFERSSTSESIQITILNNEVADDPDKYFDVLIQNASSDSGEIGEIYLTTVIITDDGDAGFLAFRQDYYTVSESVSGLFVDLVRTVKFSGNSVIEVEVVDIPDGAVDSVDYVIANKTIEVADQQKQASINISITNDLTYQDHKVFKLKLRVVSGRITIDESKAVATVEILDDGDISPPGLVSAIEVVVISGGAVNVSWVAPGYLGAKAVVSLSYTVRVMEVQTGAIQELPTRMTSIIIPQLHARTAYTVTTAAHNGYLMGNYTTAVNVLMGAPSPPSMPLDVQVVAVTGGMATLVWTVPFDSGGSSIKSYRVNISGMNGVFVGSYSPSGTTVMINNLIPSASYSATILAISRAELVGAASTVISLTTTSASIPGKPTSLIPSNETGGVFLVDMTPPLDIGGVPILNFTLLMTSAQYPNVFRQVYQGPSSSFLATKLTFSTAYKLQYKVTNSVGTSELSDVFTATTKYLSPPGQAQKLISLSRTGGSVTFSWTPPADFGGVDVTSYDIFFFLGYEVKAQYQQRVSGISPQATSVTAKVVGLVANSTYGFSVSGVNDATVCEDPLALLTRTIVYDSTDPSVSIPDTPTNLAVVSSTSGTQTIKWTASEDTGGGLLLSYALYSSTGALLYNDTSTTFTIGSLIKGTTYGYKVVARNEMGTSTPSPLVVATTKAVTVAPSQPRDFTKINSTGGSINLTWKVPLDSGGDTVSGYKLQRNGIRRADIPAGGPTMVFLDDQGLEASREYVYVVQANNSIGLGAVSQTLRTSTSDATVPSPPTRLDVVASGGNLTATWVAASNTGGIDLTSFHFTVKADTSSTGFSTSTNTSQLAYTLFGLRAMNSYTVSVTSKNAIGEALPIIKTVENGAAVPPAAPPVPEQITDTSGLQAWMIMLKLYLPVDDGGAPISKLNLYQNGEKKRSYLVEASTSQAELGDPTTRSMLVQIGPLHAATSYFFAVSALSTDVTAGEGARSDTLKVLTSPATLPSTPTNVVVSLRTSFSVVLVWDASIDTGGDEVMYEIASTNINTTENGQTETNKTTVEVPKLIPGDVYSFRVRSRNSAGVSGWTADIFAETDVTQRGAIVFSVNTLTVYENVSSVTIQLRRVNGSSSTVTATYAIGTGTASEGTHYSLPPESARSLTFVGELTVQSFEVNIINDETYLPIPRTLNLTLTDTTPGRSDPFSPTYMIINILDDGDAGMIGFVESEVAVVENARILPLQLQRLKGKDSAVSARVVLFTGLESTTQPEDGFRLPSTTVDFINGQTSSPASIVIKDNGVYNFPYLYFYLTVQIVSGGATIGTNSVLKVVVQDDGDRSVPGIMSPPTLDKATGGMLRLKWNPPDNVGGQNLWISGYSISLRVDNSTNSLPTPDNSTMLPVGGLKALTTYIFTIAAINTIGRGLDSPSVSFTTKNVTAPGPTGQITLTNRTGGLLNVSVTPPIDTGGAPVGGYKVYLAAESGDFKLAYDGTGLPSSMIPVSVSKPNTAYRLQAQAVNSVGDGDLSESFSFVSGPLSRPGPPRLPSTFSSRTGGSISLLLRPPLDNGGHENVSYMIYYREQGFRNRFRKAYYYAKDTSITVFRLAAETTYEMVGVSLLDNDTKALASGNISVSDSFVVLDKSVAADLVNSTYFDFGGYIFEVDSTATTANNTVEYSLSLSTDGGAIVSSSLQNWDTSDVFIRGPISTMATFITDSPTKPGVPPESTLSYATGGALHISISWPNDTGGVPITGYEFYIDNKTVDGNLYAYNNQSALDLQVTVEIGGLSPKTTYSFYYIPLNDASACHGGEENLPQQSLFSTGEPSKPTQILLVRSKAATGGGIHVDIKPPIDRGSDQTLYYQVYMSLSRGTPMWRLVFNNTGTSYWQTKLEKDTDYLFIASCMNEVGSTQNSSIFILRTTLTSPPGPPSNLSFISATGGLVKFSWNRPDDDGGSPITYYQVRGIDLSGERELVLKTTLANISFGGLLANNAYEFKVFAVNSWGVGSDAGVKQFSTTAATLPSLPGTPIVQKTSGGSATLEIQVPQDTGGISIEKLSWDVYANGVKLPGDAVRKSVAAPTAALSAGSRRLESRQLIADDESMVYLQAGGLLPSTTYLFTVQALNTIGGSDTTEGTTDTTSVATVPGAPEPPKSVSITGGAIEVSWSDPVDTGGVPLTSYRLSMTRSGKEVGYCEGMILSCTIGNLLSITDYQVTLFANNTIGMSPPSAVTTFSTVNTSLPLAPQDVHVAEVENVYVSIHWSPCIDFGGGYVQDYQVDVVQTSDPSVTFTASVPLGKENATINGLTPDTAYTAMVRAVTGDAQLGKPSNTIFFTTPRYANQPRPPAVGCHSRKVAIVYWEVDDDALSYLLYRDGVFYRDNKLDITYEDEIVLGQTYSYQLQLVHPGGIHSSLSEATTFVATTPTTTGFDCVGNRGHIHWHDYNNSDHEIWTIVPPTQSGLLLSFSMFWLECDHDSLTINVTTNGEMKNLWKGGCYRNGSFVVTTAPGIEKVTLTFNSDENITYEGMALHYEAVDPSDAVESVSAPCPFSSNGYCSLNGACRKGYCSCFSGYVGESCTNAVICPEDLSTCTQTSCDPVCLQSQSDVIVVSGNGDDTQGKGERMNTSPSGTDPKAVKTLRRALELATPQKTILLYPGSYSGVDNCGLTVSVSPLIIRGLRGQIVTTIDCEKVSKGLIISSGPVRLVGLTVQNTVTSTNGAAISVSNSEFTMENSTIRNASSGQNGGAIYATQAQLKLINTELSNNQASMKGGAVFLDGSSLTLDHTVIKLSSAQEGGGIYALNAVTINGDSKSKIRNNSATVNGGGLCVAGTFSGNTLTILQNKATVGAGVSITSGSSTLEYVNILKNRGLNDGGGIALLNTASLLLKNSPIRANVAVRYGGGVFMGSNGTFENNVASEITNCSAASGGGFYAGDWTLPTVNNLVVHNSSATTSGGCTSFSRSTATLSNARLDKCDASAGGGLYAGAESKVSLLHGLITDSTATNGAAMYVDSSSVVGASDTPSKIQDCSATAAAGGVFIAGTRTHLQYVIVERCLAPLGAGISVRNALTATIEAVNILTNKATRHGGGLYAESSTITVGSVSVTSNTAVVGGGVYVIDSSLSGTLTLSGNSGDRGGGAATSGITTLEGATIVSNTATQQGGGLAVESGVLSLKTTTIQYCNASLGVGGGISVSKATLKHSAVVVNLCKALRGGGIYVDSSEVYQFPSGVSQNAATLTQNQADEYGGSVFVTGEGALVSDIVVTKSVAPSGGGFAMLNAVACVILNADISLSTATDSGGGVYFGSGSNCVLRDSLIYKNRGDKSGGGGMLDGVTVYHSNVAISNNVAPTAGGVQLTSGTLPVSLLSWEDAATKRSRIDTNAIDPIGGNGANVGFSCNLNCTLSGVVVSGANLASGQGGGVFISGSGNTTIFDSLIINNYAVKGGGIAVDGAKVTFLHDVALVGNGARDNGGGLWATGANVYVMNCVFYNNSAQVTGGAIALYGVNMESSRLMVVENHAGDNTKGVGGGLYVDKRLNLDTTSNVRADTWLFLSNDAFVGGSIAAVKESLMIVSDSNITRDADKFLTMTWQDLFEDLVGFKYVAGRAQNRVAVQKGDLVYLSDLNTTFKLFYSFASNGSADAGGGFYINANAIFYCGNSELSSNTANERGGSVCLSNGALARFENVTVRLSVSKTAGGGIFLDTSSIFHAQKLLLSGNFADDSGGGIYMDTGNKISVVLNDSTIEHNIAHGEGCGIFVGQEAVLVSYKSNFIGNGGIISGGKNEGGGAISSVDGVVKLTDCALINNTAVVGGAINVDRSGSTTIMRSNFTGNTADQIGGAIALNAESKATIALQTRFTRNVADAGGAIAGTGTSVLKLTLVVFHENQAHDNGGALYLTDQASVTLNRGDLHNNSAKLGGAVHSDEMAIVRIFTSKFIANAAYTRGGALYYESIVNTTTSGITCQGNTAPSGGCIFWISTDKNLTSINPCTSCSMASNEVYDIATNVRDVHVMWWPENITSGVKILESPDEESIDAISARNFTLESTKNLWPRLKAVDLYGQVEVLDNQTECYMTNAMCSEQTELLMFSPLTVIRASKGVVTFREAVFIAANRTPEEGIYTANVSCTLPDLEPRGFAQSVKLLPCLPGFWVNQGYCERCPTGTYSLDGFKCFNCPSGAKCSQNVRRATQTLAEELGTVSPRTQEGYYMFSAPASKQESACKHPLQWKDEDPCKKLALKDPTANLSDTIHTCSIQIGFDVYWSADRLFSCLSGKSLYTCDVKGACHANISLQTITLAASVNNASCASGYDQAICSVCADGFKRASDNSCLSCGKVNAQVRASIRWQNFVIPVLLLVGVVCGIIGVRIYLRDLTEISLLAKAEADRRLKPFDAKIDQRKSVGMGLVERVKNKITARYKEFQTRNQKKQLFDVDVSPPTRTFPITPNKFKIFIGFFQIFGNFQNSFVVKWSTNVQNLMNFSQKFNLDLVAIAGIDCVVTKTFYFDFTVTVSLVAIALLVITAYFHAGMRSYRAKLRLIPRNCVMCGLPVLESKVIQNDNESFNPLRILRGWWETRQRFKDVTSRNPTSKVNDTSENKTSIRKLKRELGMSQVRTAYLGLYCSEHKECPGKKYVLPPEIQARTIRSNLRVWQARVKLRMNFLTYRNKCLKLYCWMAVFLYPSVSKTILTIYNCQEVGDVYYLVVDRRLVCYNGQWAIFGMIASIGVVVWVVGIPLLFGLLIWIAQDRGVAARIYLLSFDKMHEQRRKWINEVEKKHIEDGRFVRDMHSKQVQNEELAKFMKWKNLRDSTVQARLGFIYAEYSDGYWWYEAVDLSRKLFLSGVIVFVENGSVEQMLLAMCVCLVTMWFVLYFQPYNGYSDNLVASITQLQLFFTLWLGVMIRLNDLNVESIINVQLLSYLLVGSCIAVTAFGFNLILREGLTESRRVYAEEMEQYKEILEERIQFEIRKRWFQAINYAFYEIHMRRDGGQLGSTKFSARAMLAACHQERLREKEEKERTLPNSPARKPFCVVL